MHNKTLNALQFSDITVQHHENDEPTYTVLWSPVMLSSTVISTSEWSTETSGLTISNEANTADNASARFSASSPGRYRAVNKIKDSAGDSSERYITFVFRDNNRNYDYGF